MGNKIISIKDKKDFAFIKKLGKKFVCDIFLCLSADVDINYVDFNPSQKKVFLGIISTKKVAGAVQRNKLRRRIKAIMLRVDTKNNRSFIFIARFKIFKCSFFFLNREIERCVEF